jgi:3-oxoacyl-[acyl-carrier-protein] synthase-3
MRLKAINFALPGQVVDSKTVAEWSGLQEKFIADKIGIRSRAFLKDERPLELAKAACGRLAAESGLDLRRVKLLVYVTQNPDYKIPHSSALLQAELGLGDDVAAFDVSLGCSGFVYALSVAKAFMVAEDISDALLVTCDPYSRIMDRADRDTISLFGDAAAAAWLSGEGGAEIGRLDFGTDGAGAEHLIVRAGGAARPFSSLYHEAPAEEPKRDYRLAMNGRGIFNFMMTRVPTSMQRALQKNGLKVEDIDLFAFHQGSRFLLEQMRDKLKLPPEKVIINLERYGNTVSSSIPIILAEQMKAGELAGKKVLISGFGVGLSWATNVLSY